MKRLYSADRSDIIWTDDEILTLKEHCTPEVAWAVDLAAHTGLRQGDLVRLTWSDIKGNEIVRQDEQDGRRGAHPGLRRAEAGAEVDPEAQPGHPDERPGDALG
jgi:integrase